VGAVKELLPEVSDPIAVAELVRILEDLPEQARPAPSRARRVPGRSRAWQPTIDLSNDVLRGLGVSYKYGFASAPGYVLKLGEFGKIFLSSHQDSHSAGAVRVQSEHELVHAAGPLRERSPQSTYFLT